MVITLAVQNDLKLHQMDVITAFFLMESSEEPYMKQPEGYEIKDKEDLVCQLKRESMA